MTMSPLSSSVPIPPIRSLRPSRSLSSSLLSIRLFHHSCQLPLPLSLFLHLSIGLLFSLYSASFRSKGIRSLSASLSLRLSSPPLLLHFPRLTLHLVTRFTLLRSLSSRRLRLHISLRPVRKPLSSAMPLHPRL
jgi:hypothetical protein